MANTLACRAELVGPDVREISPATAATQAVSWLATEYRACLSASEYSLELIRARQIDGDEIGESTVGLAGTLASLGTAALPQEVALIVTWRTDHATRWGRGRNFIPSPLSAAYLASHDAWGSGLAYWTAVTAWKNKVLAGRDFTDGGFDYHMSGRLWSRKMGQTYDLTAGTLRVQPHWLRSRAA